MLGCRCSNQSAVEGSQGQRAAERQFQIKSVIDGQPVLARKRQDGCRSGICVQLDAQVVEIAEEGIGVLGGQATAPFRDDEDVADLPGEQGRCNATLDRDVLERRHGARILLVGQDPAAGNGSVENDRHC